MTFLHKKSLGDAAPGLLQVVINQCCGLVIFLVLSLQLDKTVFGEINWTLAVLLTAFSILSFGIDQLMVKKIAAGSSPDSVASLYLLHTLLTGGVFYILLLAGSFLFPSFFTAHYFLLWFAIARLAVFVASVFRQLANGQERYRLLAIMMVVSNVFRAMALLALWWFNRVNAVTVTVVFIAGDLAELLAGWWLAKKRLQLQISFAGGWPQYRLLLKEALPQLGSTVIAGAAARMDWILMGLMGMTVQLADYSFAYKIFEMAMLPLAVAGTLLMPRITRMFNTPGSDKGKLLTLLRLEMVLAAGTALVLCILWVPVVDWFTRGRYGAVNSGTILLLGAAIPFLYLNNLLWTILFAKGYLRQIFLVMLAVFLFNLAGNLLLLPRYSGEGAAMAWLAACALQSILLLSIVKIKQLVVCAGWLPFCILCAAGVYGCHFAVPAADGCFRRIAPGRCKTAVTAKAITGNLCNFFFVCLLAIQDIYRSRNSL
jgi:O-antigen/teichoic acid export membrane protein